MTVVVLGLDALDPDIVDQKDHPNLTLSAHAQIETITSTVGEPSTHELWPTIITGLEPSEHGLTLDDGPSWGNPIIQVGSQLAEYVLPQSIRTRIGALLLNRTSVDTFRTSASYYADNGYTTLFDGRKSKEIGIPNYVVNPGEKDREHQLRKEMGKLFERDPEARGGHTSADPETFYERCLEMVMIRIARIRRALRGQEHELIFGYTSGLDLIGHISYDNPQLQQRAYSEVNEFVGELANDLEDQDELVLVSDHGLQNGVHTETAMIASTSEKIVESVNSVVDVRGALEQELDNNDHSSERPRSREPTKEPEDDNEQVREHLEDLGYM